MLRRNDALIVRMESPAAVFDERQRLPFRVCEIERQASIAPNDFASNVAGIPQPLLPKKQARFSRDAQASACDAVQTMTLGP